MDDYEFFLGNIVSSTSLEQRPDGFGFVQKADSAQRTATVAWYKVEGETKPSLSTDCASGADQVMGSPEMDLGVVSLVEVEECAVYDLKLHDEHYLPFGNVVPFETSLYKSSPTKEGSTRHFIK
jgi:hypothetical protein